MAEFNEQEAIEEYDKAFLTGYGGSFDPDTGEQLDYDEEEDSANFPLDSFEDGEALASAGLGTDEDYGYYGTDDF